MMSIIFNFTFLCRILSTNLIFRVIDVTKANFELTSQEESDWKLSLKTSSTFLIFKQFAYMNV